MAYSVVAVGDILIHTKLAERPSASNVYGQLRSATHCFANLENPLTNATQSSDKLICVKGEPRIVAELEALETDVVSFANNHTMDYGQSGVRDTLEALKKAGIACVGAGEDVRASLSAAYFEADGVSAAFLAVATTLPNGSAAGPDRLGAAPVRVSTHYFVDPTTIQETPGISPFVETRSCEEDVADLVSAIRIAKQKAEFVIVGVHWGIPFGWVAAHQDEIAGYQQPLARAMIDAGASAIIGHHPHVLHGVEFYKGVPIFYSLGNFILQLDIAAEERRGFPPYRTETLSTSLSKIGGLARLEWNSASELPQCVILPVSLDRRGEPTWANDQDFDTALTRVRNMSARYGTAVAASESTGHKVLRVGPAT